MASELEQYLFINGRDFRTFREFYAADGTGITEGATLVIRAVAPTNIVLTGLTVTLDNGFLRARTYSGGTTGGAFNIALPSIPRNAMTDVAAYTPKVVLTAGGTYNLDGPLLDVLRVKVENSAGAAASVTGGQDDERGVGPGVYYFVLSNIGAGVAEGVFRASWSERG
jgi:hypothetical protein